MMTPFLVFTVLLVVAGAFFVIPLINVTKRVSSTDREQINKTYFNHRLNELHSDEAQGVIIEREELVKELQKNLLVDIPQTSEDKVADKPVQWLTIFLGIAVLLAVTLFSYSYSGGLKQYQNWQQVVGHYDALKTKYETDTLTQPELEHFTLAVRSKLTTQPNNLVDLLTLGKLGMMKNDPQLAIHAFQKAYTQAPNDADALAYYGYISLMYSQNDTQSKYALVLLNNALKKNPDNLFVIKTLAFYSLESKDKEKMHYYWNLWLSKLPEDSPNRSIVLDTLKHIESLDIKDGSAD